MNIERFIATVKGSLSSPLKNKIFIETVLFSDENKPDNEIKQEALAKISLTGHDYSSYEIKIERREIVELNTDLIPTENGRILDPDGSLLRELKNYILNNRKSLIGNNWVKLFYDSSIKKIEIRDSSSSSLKVSLVNNLPENFKILFYI